MTGLARLTAREVQPLAPAERSDGLRLRSTLETMRFRRRLYGLV